MADLEAEGGSQEGPFVGDGSINGPTSVLFRIEEVTGVPSPSAGVSTDLYWQLDVGNKRATGHTAKITGSAEATSCEARFHDDFVVKRAQESDQILVTLRSSALGNGCFGKVVIDVTNDLANERVGAPDEPLVMKWFSLVPYFKSNDPQMAYDMKFRVIAKIVAPPAGAQIRDGTCVTALHNQSLSILNDPKGTLPGVPIKSLLFLHRTAGAEKIAKGSLLVDTMGESKVLVAGKIGKRRSFWSSGEAASSIFPGVSAVLDADSGLMERDAQELINKVASGSGSTGASSPSTAAKHGLADLSRSPRASQRASLLFKGAPKVTEFDDVSTTYCWAMTLPVPHSLADGSVLPPSSQYANDGTDIFGELGKTTQVAFGVRHVVNARCGLMVPAQTPFIVHNLGAQNVEPMEGKVDVDGASVTVKALLHLDYSNVGPSGKPDYTLEVSLKGKGKSNLKKASIQLLGAIGVGSDGALGNEWKAWDYEWLSPGDSVLKQKLTSAQIFGPPTRAHKTFTTAYFLSVSLHAASGATVDVPKTELPANLILDPKLAAVAEDTLQGGIDTLQMKSNVVDTPIIAIPAIYPEDTVSLYSEEGKPITFDSVFEQSETASGGRRGGKKFKRGADTEDANSNIPPSPAGKRKSKKEAPVQVEDEPVQVDES
jgi:hypothetical protein